MATRRNVLGLAALVAFEAVAVAALHRLGALPWLVVPLDDLGGWLAVTPVEDAIVAVLRLVALGCAYWLLASTLLYTAARLSRVPAAIRATRWATLPGVRRVADRAVAVALLTSSVAGGAPPALAAVHASAPLGAVEAAEPLAPPAVSGPATLPGPSTAPPPPDGAGPRSSGDRQAGRPADRGVVADAPPEEAPADAPPPPEDPPRDRPAPNGPPRDRPTPNGPPASDAPPAPDAETVHTVVAGDNLWTIVAEHLAAGRGETPSDDDIRRVWLEVIEANRPTLRSGDPDLIYPGERIRLPPLPAGPD